MTGYVKLTAITTVAGREGIGVEMALKSVSSVDKLEVIYALCSGLDVTPKELKVMAMFLERRGFELDNYMKKGGVSN